jgi:poly(A) polymerase
VIDYVDGMKDLKARQVRPIIPLPIIFQDDPVRMIRAVKYAAITGFKIPFMLRRQIKKDAALLAGISPSRLTEEMYKIINSSQSACIVEQLEDFGLYASLQPNASKLMKTNPEYKKKYLGNFAPTAELIQETKLLAGSPVLSLIRDVLEMRIDWGSATHETYKDAYALAREFVLPINPSRDQLAFAVVRIFQDHGIVVKRQRRPSPSQERDARPPQRRRNRRRKPSTEKPTPNS